MFTRVIDISLPLVQGMLSFPGDCPYRDSQSLFIDRGDRCNLSSFEMSMHSGTHLDAPLHFVAGGKPIDQMDPASFFGKVRVILIETGEQITAADLTKWEIKKGDRILLKVPFNEVLLGQKEFTRDFIGLTTSAAEFLVAQKVPLVGVEYLSVEKSAVSHYQVHPLLLKHDVIILEGIDLRQVEPGEYYLACFPLNLVGGNGAPVRAVLLA